MHQVPELRSIQSPVIQEVQDLLGLTHGVDGYGDRYRRESDLEGSVWEEQGVVQDLESPYERQERGGAEGIVTPGAARAARGEAGGSRTPLGGQIKIFIFRNPDPALQKCGISITGISPNSGNAEFYNWDFTK